MQDVFIHPTALVETDRIGAGTRIWAFAHIMEKVDIGACANVCDHVFVESGARLGKGVTVKNNALIWSGVEIGDYVFIGPAVVFTNDRYPRSPRLPDVGDRYADEEGWKVKTIVESGVSIGARSVILPGVRLGAFCMVAAGSVVTCDVSPYRLVAGNPARPRGWVGRQGEVLRVDGEQWKSERTGKRYRIGDQGPVEVDA